MRIWGKSCTPLFLHTLIFKTSAPSSFLTFALWELQPTSAVTGTSSSHPEFQSHPPPCWLAVLTLIAEGSSRAFKLIFCISATSVALVISYACPSCKQNSLELYCWYWQLRSTSITHCHKWKEQESLLAPRNTLPAIVSSAIITHARSLGQAPVSHKMLLSADGEGPSMSWLSPWLLRWESPCCCGIPVKQKEKHKDSQEFLAINSDKISGCAFYFYQFAVNIVHQPTLLSIPGTYYITIQEAQQLFLNVIVKHLIRNTESSGSPLFI